MVEEKNQNREQQERREEKKGVPYRRHPVVTDRDETTMTTLYALTIASIEQLAKAHFPSVDSARKRMGELFKNGYVEKTTFVPRNSTKSIGLWYLKPRPYRREAKNAGRPEETYPEFPKRMNHHLKTNDLFADICKPLSSIFDEELAEGSNWLWKNESHASLRYEYAGRTRGHQPDAEIHFPDGRLFCIERQTRESRETQQVFRDKVEGFYTYTQYMGFEEKQAKLVFACDDQRDQDYADKAMQDYKDLPGVVTDPSDAAQYIVEHAKGSG